MTVAQIKDIVELVMLVTACVSPVVWIVLEKRIDARLEAKLESVYEAAAEVRGCVDDLEGRVSAVEWFRDQNAANINAIPRTVTILERLESTLERLDTTLGDVGIRVARMEGPKK